MCRTAYSLLANSEHHPGDLGLFCILAAPDRKRSVSTAIYYLGIVRALQVVHTVARVNHSPVVTLATFRLLPPGLQVLYRVQSSHHKTTIIPHRPERENQRRSGQGKVGESRGRCVPRQSKWGKPRVEGSQLPHYWGRCCPMMPPPVTVPVLRLVPSRFHPRTQFNSSTNVHYYYSVSPLSR
jgi:hypothetical protein